MTITIKYGINTIVNHVILIKLSETTNKSYFKHIFGGKFMHI